MAIVRAVLNPTGLVLPQHGMQVWESDMDANLVLLNSLLTSVSGVNFFSDLAINGVVSGFTLTLGSGLVPGTSTGVLYAQGARFGPASAPILPAAPASATNYLFYNSSTGFYYQTSPVGATAGDALIGVVTTSGSAVTVVVQATTIFGVVAVTSSAAGNITVPHLLGRTPVAALVRMTSASAIWWQNPTDMDATNLYLVASDVGVTAKITLW